MTFGHFLLKVVLLWGIKGPCAYSASLTFILLQGLLFLNCHFESSSLPSKCRMPDVLNHALWNIYDIPLHFMNFYIHFESIRRNLNSLTTASNEATVPKILQDLRLPSSHFPDGSIKKKSSLEMWNTSAHNTNSPESESCTSAQEMTTILQKLRPAGRFISK